MKKKVPELSVIITAHDEGLLAHKTMLSIFETLKNTDVEYEIIVHIDCGSDETIKYFERYAKDKRFKIIQNTFGDSGESRNAAVRAARGKYVLFRDADDLVSSNYVSEVMKILRSHKGDVVVGFQYCLSFWDCTGQLTLLEIPDSTTREENAKLMFGVNPWGSSLAGKREIFIKYPYIALRNGFGHEDYALNIELMANNIPYRSAPDTVLFYRRKADSLIVRNTKENATQPYSKLFDYKTWQKYSEPKKFTTEQDKDGATKLPKPSLLKDIYRVARHDSKVLNGLIQPLATGLRKITGKKLIEGPEPKELEIPEAVLRAWKEQNQIEMQLFPTPNARRYIMEYNLDADPARYISHEYWQLCKQITHTPDYIFIVPWIVAGGADKVLLNYATALHEVHPDWKITIITTRPEKNTWQDRLPDGTNLIEFGQVAKELDEYCRDVLLTRLLVQLQCKKLHIINSLDGYQWVYKHPELAKTQFEIAVTLFADGQMTDGDGGWWGYGDPYLARIYPAVNKIFTENQNYIDSLVEKNAFDHKKMLAIYQPIKITKSRQRTRQSGEKLRILWASRVVPSKNPELVIEIARKLDSERYQLDVFGRLDETYKDFRFPDDLPVLNYHGEFDGFNSLPTEEYDVLLYTSYSDGMPNVVLEAAAAGLPVIASNVGGISNFIDPDETGFLVDAINDADKYIEVLEKIYNDPEKLQKISSGALERLKQQHSWKKFCEVVKQKL